MASSLSTRVVSRVGPILVTNCFYLCGVNFNYTVLQHYKKKYIKNVSPRNKGEKKKVQSVWFTPTYFG